ncbi:CopG family ribbon-helix-helix protein [Propionibacteriaceae bacterium G1746]|uniref:CopG family ribbon-helix-helix protein n=1 Tax=Aestuariimicrobium sp. G57 TaxID=3418485 RepID=UPI003C1693C8
MGAIKLSVSLSDDELAALDKYVQAAGLPSRSAGIQHAIKLLGDADLDTDYEEAFQEWEESGEGSVWDSTASDGLSVAPR